MSVLTHEQLSRQIVDGAQEAIIFADHEGKIRLWNAGATAIFGYSAEEALNQSLDLIIPERQQKRHWDGYEKVMAFNQSGTRAGICNDSGAMVHCYPPL